MLQVKSQPIAVTRDLILSLIMGEFKRAATELPQEFAEMSQKDLETIRKPTEIDHYLRNRLWDLIGKAQNGLIHQIQQVDIYAGICTETNWTQRVCKSPQRVAWLLMPPQDDMDRMKAGLAIGLTNLIDFIANPINKETAGAFIKAISILLDRVHGPVVQRLDTRNLNVNVDKKEHSAASVESLKQLKEKIESAVDVTPVDPSGTEGV